MEIKKNEIKYLPNKTGLIARIIFIFFGLIALGGMIFYFYNEYQAGKELGKDDVEFLDKDFNNLFKDDERRNEERVNEIIEYEDNNCYIDHVMVESGKKIKLYSKEIVSSYKNCDDYSKERLCNDGFMMGDDKFRFSKCKIDIDCQLPDGSILKNDESRKFYSKKQVPFGITCEKYALHRVCKNTVLTGDDNFIYNNCSISYDNSCSVPSGHLLADNQSHLFYNREIVDFGEKCTDFSVRLMCTDAVMQGGNIDEYKYWDCAETAPKDCYINQETVIEHGSSRAMYSKEYGTSTRDCNFFKEVRACYNGRLDGQAEYSHVNCYDN